MSRVVLIGAGSTLETQARKLLGNEVVTIAPASSEVLVSRMIWLERRPELVVLGDQMPPVLALWLSRSLRDLADVIALVTDDVTLRIQAEASGVTDFLSPEADLEQVDALVDRSRERVLHLNGVTTQRRQAARGIPGAVVAVTSPKGGVGKTTVASNLAVGLARSAPGRVALVDLDLQFGDIATVLSVEHRHSVADALGKAAARDPFVLGTFLTEHPSGIAVLAAPSSPAAADHLDAARVSHMLRQLAADFDHVVVDTGPGLGDAVLAAVEQSSVLVMVAGLDLPSARGVRTSYDVLRELDIAPQARHLVVNQIAPSGGMTVADAERVIGAPVDIVIPSRRAVSLSVNRGIAVVEDAPRDPASRALLRLVQRIESDAAGRDARADRRKELVP